MILPPQNLILESESPATTNDYSDPFVPNDVIPLVMKNICVSHKHLRINPTVGLTCRKIIYEPQSNDSIGMLLDENLQNAASLVEWDHVCLLHGGHVCSSIA